MNQIITTIEQIKEHIATIVGAEFSRYKPYVQTAENWLRREIVGEHLFTILADDENLLYHCRAIVSHKAYLEAIPFLDLVETESGFAVTSNQNLTPASTKRVQDLIAATAKRLDECVEDLLEFLEGHEDETILNAWISSKTYTLINDNFVRSLREFRNYGKYAGTRLQFIEQRYRLAQLRRMHIETVISRQLTDQIIEQLRDDDLSDPNKEIINDLRYCLVSFFNDDTGTALSFLAKVHKQLVSYPDDYPLYKASDIYATYLANKQPTEETSSIGFFGV